MMTANDFKRRLELIDGLLYWRSNRCVSEFSSVAEYKRFMTRHAGKMAGHVEVKDGIEYQRVVVNNRKYLAHQIVWFMETGEWAESLDHKDGNGLNNNPSNLRRCTPAINAKNRRMGRNNTSGCTGVYWRNDRKRWAAAVGYNGRRISLGNYDDFDDAVAAREAWLSAHPEYTKRHGRDRL